MVGQYACLCWLHLSTMHRLNENAANTQDATERSFPRLPFMAQPQGVPQLKFPNDAWEREREVVQC